LICDSILKAVAKPAASSDALLMRLPEESLSIAVSSVLEVSAKLRCADRLETFVITPSAIFSSILVVKLAIESFLSLNHQR
jgi:hypothetical protein